MFKPNLNQREGADYAHHVAKARFVQTGIFSALNLFACENLVIKSWKSKKIGPLCYISFKS
jgi:hypothetical protein